MPATDLAVAALSGFLVGVAVRPVIFNLSVPAKTAPRLSCPECSTQVLAPPWCPLQSASGRCLACKAPFPPGAFVPEIATAASFAAIAAGGAEGWFAAAQYWLAALGIPLVLIDMLVQRLPTVLTLPSYAGTALLLTGASLADESGSWHRSAAATVVVTVAFLCLAPMGMGLGDVKLAPSIGALLGWRSWYEVWWGTVTGFLAGAAFAVVLLMSGQSRASRIAFGPFMLIGAFIVSVPAS